MAGGAYLYLARRKGKNVHVLLRALNRRALDTDRYVCDYQAFDDLLAARDPRALIEAVEGLPPLSIHPLCAREVRDDPRCQTVGQFRRRAASLYDRIDQGALLDEYSGVRGDGGAVTRNSIRTLSTARDAMEDGAFEGFLDAHYFSDEDLVVAEPLSDWIFAKAVLSDIVLFQAAERGGARGGFMDAVENRGWWIPAGDRLDGRHLYAKQLVFNPYFRSKSLAGEALNELRGDQYWNDSPLLRLFLDIRTGRFGTAQMDLANSDRFHVLTGPDLTGAGIRLDGYASYADRSLYLVADGGPDGGSDAGATQSGLARDFTGAVLKTTRALRSCADSEGAVHYLGWDDDPASAVEQGCYAPVCRSALSALVWFAAFHGADYVARTCDQCARPMLNRARVRTRKFCCPACRTAYGREHAAGKTEGRDGEPNG